MNEKNSLYHSRPLLFCLLALQFCASGNGDDEEEPAFTLSGIKTRVVLESGSIPEEPHGFISMDASDTGAVVLAAAAHGKLYYSDDGGIAWYTLDGIGTDAYWTGASVSADGRTLAVAGDRLYVSLDSGDNWTSYPFVDFYDGDARLYVSSDGKSIAKIGENTISECDVSHDYGVTWIENSFEDISDQIEAAAISSDGSRVAALHYYAKLRISDDGGKTWKTVATGEKQWADMEMSSDGRHFALLNAGSIDYGGAEFFDVVVSHDSGASWTSQKVPGIASPRSIAMSDDGQKMLVSGITADAPFMYSKDDGDSWEQISTPEQENPNWPQYTVAFAAGGDRIVAMERSYSVWTSEDSGSTWTKRLGGSGEE